MGGKIGNSSQEKAAGKGFERRITRGEGVWEGINPWKGKEEEDLGIILIMELPGAIPSRWAPLGQPGPAAGGGGSSRAPPAAAAAEGKKTQKSP